MPSTPEGFGDEWVGRVGADELFNLPEIEPESKPFIWFVSGSGCTVLATGSTHTEAYDNAAKALGIPTVDFLAKGVSEMKLAETSILGEYTFEEICDRGAVVLTKQD